MLDRELRIGIYQMRIAEIENQFLVEVRVVWARSGDNVKRKVRCSFGPRKGRVVADVSQCTRPIDIQKRFVLRRTKLQKGPRMIRKAQKAKRINPASRKLNLLNRSKKVQLGAYKNLKKKKSTRGRK